MTPKDIKDIISSGLFDGLMENENKNKEEMNRLILTTNNIDFIEECVLNGRYYIPENIDLMEELRFIGRSLRLHRKEVMEEWNRRIDTIRDKIEEKRKKIKTGKRDETLATSEIISNEQEDAVEVYERTNSYDTELPIDEGKICLEQIVESCAKKWNVLFSEINGVYKEIVEKMRRISARNNKNRKKNEINASPKGWDDNDSDR